MLKGDFFHVKKGLHVRAICHSWVVMFPCCSILLVHGVQHAELPELVWSD